MEIGEWRIVEAQDERRVVLGSRGEVFVVPLGVGIAPLEYIEHARAVERVLREGGREGGEGEDDERESGREDGRGGEGGDHEDDAVDFVPFNRSRDMTLAIDNPVPVAVATSQHAVDFHRQQSNLVDNENVDDDGTLELPMCLADISWQHIHDAEWLSALEVVLAAELAVKDKTGIEALVRDELDDGDTSDSGYESSESCDSDSDQSMEMSSDGESMDTDEPLSGESEPGNGEISMEESAVINYVPRQTPLPLPPMPPAPRPQFAQLPSAGPNPPPLFYRQNYPSPPHAPMDPSPWIDEAQRE